MLELRNVVPVYRADVLQTEVLEHPLRGDHVLEALLDAVQGFVHGTADDRGPSQGTFAPVKDSLVRTGRTKSA